MTAGGFGGVLGAMALLRTSQSTFLSMVPWLLLFATALFAVSNPLRKRLYRVPLHAEPTRSPSVGLFLGLVLVSFYTGYFGAGAGILAFTTLSPFGVQSLNEVNALKAVCTTFANGVAVIVFILGGAISWPQCFVMAGFATLGGYGGAAYSRKVNPMVLRGIVIGMGALLSAYLFLHRR